MASRLTPLLHGETNDDPCVGTTGRRREPRTRLPSKDHNVAPLLSGPLRRMKVRLTSDSLRFRLDQTDTETLSKTGSVAVHLPLGPDRGLRCALDVDDHARTLSVTFSGDAVVVTLPGNRAERWLSTDEIGLEEHVQSNGRHIRVLVEKDLGCRHGEDEASETQSDTFTHLREQ